MSCDVGEVTESLENELIFTYITWRAAHDGHPNSIQGRNLDTCCTCCVTKDHWELSACSRTQDYVCLWPGYHLHHDTAKHGYSGVVKQSTGEWNGTLLSSVMGISSVCMQVINVHMYGIDLVSITFWSAFTRDTQAPPQDFMVQEAISYNSRLHLVFLQGK